MKTNKSRKKYGPSEYSEACRISDVVFEGQMPEHAAIEYLESFGINRTSANDFMVIYRSLITGKPFLRGTSASATDYFIKYILDKYGDSALPHIITALGGHIEKMIASGSKMIAMQSILTKYERLANES